MIRLHSIKGQKNQLGCIVFLTCWILFTSFEYTFLWLSLLDNKTAYDFENMASHDLAITGAQGITGQYIDTVYQEYSSPSAEKVSEN